MKRIEPLGIAGYEFKELTEESQNKAIDDHINFMIEIVPYEEGSENYRKAIDASEKMQTPWFVGSYIYDYCKDEIIESINDRRCLYTINGDYLPLAYYTKDNQIIKTVYILTGGEVEVSLYC